MKLFTVKLTDEQRAKLDAYRSFAGLRSEAEAIRLMIDTAVERRGDLMIIKDGILDTPTSGRIRTQSITQGHGKPAASEKPFKSRLKGEWKAP